MADSLPEKREGDGLVWLCTFGARMEVENQDLDTVAERVALAEREIKNVLAAHGLRGRVRGSVHGPAEIGCKWEPGALA